MITFLYFLLVTFGPILVNEIINQEFWREHRVRGYRKRWK